MLGFLNTPLPAFYLPAILICLAIFSIYVAYNPDKFLAPYKKIREQLVAETQTRDALFASSGAPKNIDFKLNRLKWPVTYRQFRIINSLISLCFAVISIVFLNNPKLAVVSAVIWYIFAHKVVELQYKKFKAKVDEQAELVLQLLAETFKITENLIDAIVLVIPSAHSPMKEELELTVKQYRMNEDLDECLRQLADRSDNRDIDTFVQGILLSLHYGTNVKLVISETAEIIRERIALKDELENEIKGKGFTITIFLIVLPVLLTGLMIKSPDARNTFLNTAKGQNLLCLALIIQFTAWYLSRERGVMDKL